MQVAITAWKALEIAWKKIWFYLNEEMILYETKNCLPGYPEKNFSLVDMVDKARREWEYSKNLFEEANDPDLVDHAIFAMEAAEKKYAYLLKLAKKEKVVDENIKATLKN